MSKRQRKKAEKKSAILLYDLNGLPENFTIDKIFKIMKNQKLCIWTSQFGAQQPKLIYGVGRVHRPYLNKIIFRDTNPNSNEQKHYSNLTQRELNNFFLNQ